MHVAEAGRVEVDAQRREPTAQTLQVPFETEAGSAERGRDLVDAVGEEEPAVVDGDERLLLGNQLAVQVDRAHEPLRAWWPGNRRPKYPQDAAGVGGRTGGRQPSLLP